jgi:hypothetical protein
MPEVRGRPLGEDVHAGLVCSTHQQMDLRAPPQPTAVLVVLDLTIGDDRQSK